MPFDHDPGHSLESSFQDTAPPLKSKTRALSAFGAAVLVAGLGVGIAAVPMVLTGALAANNAVDFWEELPDELPLEQALTQHTILLDKDGKEFARFYSENRIDVPLKKISPEFTRALVATEDARFYEHTGVDPVGMLRAVTSNASSGSRQGASTITQQLVQNLLISNARDKDEEWVAKGTDYGAKLREAKYALGLERVHTKDEILEMYSNAVYFGNGAYGVEAASKIYFDTTAAKLTTPQAASLVGLLKNPSGYDPFAHPEAAKNRRNTVLGRMATTGIITPTEQSTAAKSKVSPRRGTMVSGCLKSDYEHFCSLVRAEMLKDPAFGSDPKVRSERMSRGGLTITTSLDRKVTSGAQKAATNALGKDNRVAAAVAVVEPGTGRISAIAQNHEWKRTQIILPSRAFQPGSAMKPIVVASALEQGIDVRRKINTDGPYVSKLNPAKAFKNYGGSSFGAVDGAHAIRQSPNIYFVKLIESAGVEATADLARRIGISSLAEVGPRDLSFALGAHEASPIEMANGYATFASGGTACRAHTITAAKRTTTGAKVDTTDPACSQAISTPVADTVAALLREPFKAGGTLSKNSLSGRQAAAKTGTSNGSAANWTVGFTPQHSTAVWLGDPRGGQRYPLTYVQAFGQGHYRTNGADIAGRIWRNAMNNIHAGLPALKLPKANHAGASIPSARTMPAVRGLSVAEAATLIAEAGLKPVLADKLSKGPGTAPANVVAEQSPDPGSGVRPGSEVILTLTPGSETDVRFDLD